MLCLLTEKYLRKERQRVNLVEIVIKHPVISGSAGVFMACVLAAVLGQTLLAAFLFLAGTGLAGWQVYRVTR